MKTITTYRLKSYIYICCLGVLGLVAIINTIVYVQYHADDSFITFRYAYNLVNNGIWNWNKDNQIVEAYTNFSYAAMALLPQIFNVNPIYFFKVLNGIFYLIIIYQIYHYTYHQSKTLGLGMLFFFICNPYVYIHAYSGMETFSFLFLIFELILFLSFNVHEKWIYVILLLLPLTRPEGVVFSLTGFCLYLYINKGRIESKKTLLGVTFIGLVYFIWRLSYFGYLLPNTFYVKSVKGFSFTNLISNIYEARIYIVATIMLIWIVKNVSWRIFACIALLVFCLLYAPSSLHTNYADRFIYQGVYPIILSSFLSINQEKLRNYIIVLIFTSVVSLSYTQSLQSATNYVRSFHSHKTYGLQLKQFSSLNYSIMLGDVGMIPYFSEWKAYDFIGLADTDVAHNGLTIDYIQRKNPDLIVLYSRSADPSTVMNIYSQSVILQYMRESQQYDHVASTKTQGYYLLSFLKRNLPHENDIRRVLQENAALSETITVSFKDILLLRYLK